ncbi:MAG: hypothetical protein AAGF01_17955 [Cyanobacteria bacterium P01_G01_bin.38]
METKRLLAQDFKTGEITVISNVTSITVTGNKIARLEQLAHKQESSSTVHVDFTVKQPSHLPAVLEETEELGLILKPDDAVKLGVLLIAMGMEDKMSEIVTMVMELLSKRATENQ